MNKASDVYVHADELNHIPQVNRDNYEFETAQLKLQLLQNASVLQVGSMDGLRAIRLLQVRPDLIYTGLEIEESLVELARRNVDAHAVSATFIHGDITDPPSLPAYDFVICLNNTLSYIPDEKAAINGMKSLGKHVIISVFGEAFTPNTAREYFTSLGLKLKKSTDDYFELKGFTHVRRYTRDRVSHFGGEVTGTPLGYFCTLY